MKKIIITALAIMVVFAATLSANGNQENNGIYGGGQGGGYGLRDGSGNGTGTGRGNGQGRNSAGNLYRENFVEELASVWNIELGSGTLTTAEKDGLLLMVEEEKLARDVYIALYNEWNIPIFNNIAESEQQHMDSVQLLLDAYGIAAPEETGSAGVFANSELQKYYDELTEQGSESVEDALIVGATIEDLDIADLQKLVDASENEEVKILYQNLMKGSRNHMRSFTAQLERYNTSYEPVFIDEAYYAKIMKYNREMAPISDPDYSL